MIFFLVAAIAVSVPIAAWALRRAAAPIPVVTAAGLTTLGATAVAVRWLTGGWPGWWLPVPALLTVFAVPLALADLRHLRLPDVLTLPAYPSSASRSARPRWAAADRRSPSARRWAHSCSAAHTRRSTTSPRPASARAT